MYIFNNLGEMNKFLFVFLLLRVNDEGKENSNKLKINGIIEWLIVILLLKILGLDVIFVDVFWILIENFYYIFYFWRKRRGRNCFNIRCKVSIILKLGLEKRIKLIKNGLRKMV